MKQLVIGFLFLTGVIVLVINTMQSRVYHIELDEFLRTPEHQKFDRMVLYGYLDPIEIKKSGSSIRFSLYTKEIGSKKNIPVRLTGIIPDSSDLFGKVGVYGEWDKNQKVFIANKVLAKCSSKYEEKNSTKP